MEMELDEVDARAILRLVGDAAGFDGPLEMRKRLLMDGLAGLIHADSWALATTFRFEPGEVPLNAGFLTAGFSPEQFARFQEALEHPETALLNESLITDFTRLQKPITRHRDQIDRRQLFYKTEVFHLWQAAGVEQVILSVRPVKNTRGISQVGVYRRPGKPPFSQKETTMVHIVLAEVHWLHETILPDAMAPKVNNLAPRQRITLNLLAEGQSRAQITSHLGIRRNTVDGYVKEVFRFFGVHSQAELIARFRKSDGGDCPEG